MDDIYENIEEYNPNKKRQILIVFDDTVADILSNEKRNPVITELFIRDRKLKIFIVFIAQSYFVVPKNIRLNSTDILLLKFQIYKNSSKLHLTIHQILTLKN